MNQNQALKVAIACGLGGLIGAVAALETASAFALGKYFAFVGMLLGGVVSYLSYEFKAVVSAFARAWRSLSGWRWKPDRKNVGLYLVSWFFASVFFSSMLSVFWAVLTMIGGGRWTLAVFSPPLLTGVIVGAYAATKDPTKGGEYGVKTNRLEAYHGWREFAFYFNPVAFAVYLLLGVWWCLRRAPRTPIALYHGSIFLGKVTWRAFRYIHSDVRVLCFIDGTLGATAGYLYGHPAVGLLAGIGFGLVNYIVVRRLVFRTTEVRA